MVEAGLLGAALSAMVPSAAPSVVRPIGTATQAADGTIILQLRAEGAAGALGDAQFRYAPGDPDYARVARHVGPIPRGEAVAVAPFPER